MYDTRETRLSHQHLQRVVQELEEPVCIIGGWAVHFTVNQRYKHATGRDYLGSRDIDLGFDTTATILQAIQVLERLGFQAVAYRWCKDVEYETGRTLTQEEARQLPVHKLFPIAVDLVLAHSSKEVRDQLGFAPIDEPLLRHVFAGQHTLVRGFGRQLLLPTPAVLLATKLNTIGRREQRHKRVKDLCDIAALRLYADTPLTRLTKEVHALTQQGISVEEADITAAANATGIPAALIKQLIDVVNGA